MMKEVNDVQKSCFRCKHKACKMMLRSWQCLSDNKANEDYGRYIPMDISDKVGCDFHSNLEKGQEA